MFFQQLPFQTVADPQVLEEDSWNEGQDITGPRSHQPCPSLPTSVVSMPALRLLNPTHKRKEVCLPVHAHRVLTVK